jgi:hypothetical protein
MKIKDIIIEAKRGKIPRSHSSATPGMKAHDGLDNSSPYAPWRFASMFIPSSPDFEHDPSKQGPVGQSLTTVAYTDADHAIIDAAEKRFGVQSRRVTPNGSSENKDVHNVSPVRVRIKK